MINIISVIGTRPDIIKMSPLIKELNQSKKINNKVLFTSQHETVGLKKIKEFNLIVDFFINNYEKKDLNEKLGNLILGVSKVLKAEKPDYILVHGDTSTAISAALSAFNLNIKIIHIEAGLRSNNIYSPFPEEANRKIIDQISFMHFAPTDVSYKNLIQENIKKDNIHVVGNTISDCIGDLSVNSDNNNVIRVLITTHRRESWKVLPETIKEVIELSNRNFSNIEFTILMHPNPDIENYYTDNLSSHSNIKILKENGYLHCLNIISSSDIILTDSCGIQEESAILGVPSLILRNETERPESIDSNTSVLVGRETLGIYVVLAELLGNADKISAMQNKVSAYGDGKVSAKIVNIIENELVGEIL